MAGGAAHNLKKEAFWRRMVRRQAVSGVSVQAFCRGRGFARVSPGGLKWTTCGRAELARRDSVRDAFVPVKVVSDDAPGGGGRIEVVLANGRRLVVSGRVDRAMLADVGPAGGEAGMLRLPSLGELVLIRLNVPIR